MRIRQLTVKNFRVFGDPPPFEFSEQFTVIAGVNGRGKTALLDAIRILASRLLRQISPARSLHPRVTKYDVHGGANEFSIEITANCAGHPVVFHVAYDVRELKIRATHLTPTVARSIRNAYGIDTNRADDAAPLVVCYTTDRASFRAPKEAPSSAPSLQVPEPR